VKCLCFRVTVEHEVEPEFAHQRAALRMPHKRTRQSSAPAVTARRQGPSYREAREEQQGRVPTMLVVAASKAVYLPWRAIVSKAYV
jgi:predicted nucleic acid-binding Zn ribbon protein